MKEDEEGGECSMHGRREKWTENFSLKAWREKTDHSEDLT